jgi:hypothetical protein
MMSPTLAIMLIGMLTLLPATTALAQRPAVSHVVILKCAEDNDTDEGANGDSPDPYVHTCQDSRAGTASVCTGEASPCNADPSHPCAECLITLVQEPRRCDGGSFFTSNAVVSQLSTQPTVEDTDNLIGANQSIVTYTLACHD